MNAPHQGAVLAGRILSGLVVAFMLFSASLKFVAPEMVRATMLQLGYPPELSTGIGAVELLCTALYAVPRSSRLGAVLLTGYLGGACATHLRLLDPWLTHTLFPIWIGTLAWAGLLLRDAPLRALLASPRAPATA